MKRTILLIAAAITMALGAAAEEYHLSVGQFRKLNVFDNLNVVYRCRKDSTGTVAFNTEAAQAKDIICEVKGGELKVRVSTDLIESGQLPTIYVYSDFLSQAKNSSNGTLIVENPAPAAEIKFILVGNGRIEATGLQATEVEAKVTTGNGTISLQGECVEAKYDMLGTGTIQADFLKADLVECKCMGSGTIGCWALQTLKTKCLGSTKIYYKGDPAVTKKGGGTLYPME